MEVVAAKPRRKHRLWIRTNGRCGYCGFHTKAIDRTRDHIVAKSKGGLPKEGNLIACCRLCNLRKADMELEEFRRIYFHGDRFYVEWLEGIVLRGMRQ